MITQTTDPALFVKSLEIPADHEHEQLTDKVLGARNFVALSEQVDNKQSAQVNAGSLTSFTENLTGQSKADVQNSTLLAQLAANKKFDRFQNPMDWYKFYLEVLSNIGWNQPAFAFDEYNSGGSTVKLDDAVLGILGAIASGNEVAIVSATMNALKETGDGSHQMNIWDANGSSGNNGNFQIFPVDKLGNGDVVMILAGMQFRAQEHHGGFLWWSWSSTSIDIQRAANKFVLNEDVYAQIRQQIVDKLGDKAKTFVADLDI